MASAIDEVSDLFWAGFLGPQSMASVGVGGAFVMLLNTWRMGLDTSARAMVSRAVGAGDMPQANHIAYQSLLINTTIATLVMGTGIVAAELLWTALGVADSLGEEGLAYQRWRFAASIVFGANLVSSSLLMAGGDSFTPMKAQLAARAIHIALTPALMFGFGPVPAIGIAGGAIAYGLGHVVGSVMNFWALLAGSSRLHLRFEGLKIDVKLAWRQLQIGLPSSITGAERALSGLVIIGLVAPFGATALAVFSLASRLQGLSSFAGQSLAQAAGIIVGQNLGAQKPDRAKRTAWWALAIVGGVEAVICVLIFVVPEAFIFAFSRDPAVMALGVPWLRIAALGIFLLGVAQVLVVVLNTAGDTVIPMVSGLLSLWCIQQPLAIALTGASLDWQAVQITFPEVWVIGLLGVAWAIVIASLVRFLTMFLYFLWGPWMKKQVLLRPARAASPG